MTDEARGFFLRLMSCVHGWERLDIPEGWGPGEISSNPALDPDSGVFRSGQGFVFRFDPKECAPGAGPWFLLARGMGRMRLEKPGTLRHVDGPWMPLAGTSPEDLLAAAMSLIVLPEVLLS